MTDAPLDTLAPLAAPAAAWPPSLAAALVAAQAELRNLTADAEADVETKSGGRYSYTYASLGSLLAMARPVLAKYSLAVVQVPRIACERAGVTTTLLHASGELIAFDLMLRPAQDSPQAIGSAITYARRYSLGPLLGIATEEDDDGAAAEPPRRASRARADRTPPSAPTPRDARAAAERYTTAAKREERATARTITKAQAQRLWAIAYQEGEFASLTRDQTEAEVRGVIDRAGFASTSEIPADRYDSTLADIQTVLRALGGDPADDFTSGSGPFD